MKRILCIFVIIAALLQLVGCHLIAANVYTRYDINEDGVEIKVEVMHRHGDKNDITLERYYHPDGWLEKEISYFDYRSSDIMYIIIFSAPDTKKSAEYFYEDTNEHLVESYDDNGVLKTVHSYQDKKLASVEEYYPSGNRKTSTSYTDPALIFGTHTFEDKKDGNIISYHQRWQENGEICNQLDTYNEVGNRVKTEMEIRTTDGIFVRHYVEEYDDRGNLTKTTHYNENGEIYDVAYHK